MPSNTICGRSVKITRSLNVPGSPSSALQKIYLMSPAARRANSHFMPVGKPAPPRPRTLADLISAITSPELRPVTLASASPG